MLTITGPGALWTSRSPARDDPRHDPDPDAYAMFAGAVAARYGDRVDRYILWNEPNLGTWLRPQNSCSHGHCTPLAPTRAGRCAGFAAADGFAFHPHGVLTAPQTPFPNPDDVDLASLPRLERVLDRLQNAGRVRSTGGRLGIYIDEYGYQTNPPDGFAGISAALQDAWLQRAAYLAWRDPRVKLLTQYIWRDEPSGVGAAYAGWQSGLRYADGRAKPSLAHFPTPFVVDAARGRLWGQVRRRDTDSIAVERRLPGGSWRVVAHAGTDAQGVNFSASWRGSDSARWRSGGPDEQWPSGSPGFARRPVDLARVFSDLPMGWRLFPTGSERGLGAAMDDRVSSRAVVSPSGDWDACLPTTAGAPVWRSGGLRC